MKKLYIIYIFLSFTHTQLIAQNSGNNYAVDEKKAIAIVDRVLKHSPIIDGHNDLFIWYFGCNYKHFSKCPQEIADYPIDTITKGHTDIPRWRKGGVGGVLLNVYADSLSSFLDAYDLLYRLEKKYAADLKVVTNSTQMRNAMHQGKIALLPMLEGSVRLENKTSLLRSFFRQGLRCVTFTYRTSELADGSDDIPKHNGISAIGKDMVAEMNRLGIIIDMSHISAKSMSDILDITQAPVIFSHSNARAVCDVNRNVPDDILLRLKKNNGIIMIDMAPEHVSNLFVKWMTEGDSIYYATKKQFPGNKQKLNEVMTKWENDYPRPVVNIAEVADHFDHVKNLIGVDHIGISGDYDGIEYTVAGMEDVSCFPKILKELAMRGWTETDLAKITAENFLRVFEEIEKKALLLSK